MRWKNGSNKIKLELDVFIWKNTVKRDESDYSEGLKATESTDFREENLAKGVGWLAIEQKGRVNINFNKLRYPSKEWGLLIHIKNYLNKSFKKSSLST